MYVGRRPKPLHNLPTGIVHWLRVGQKPAIRAICPANAMLAQKRPASLRRRLVVCHERLAVIGVNEIKPIGLMSLGKCLTSVLDPALVVPGDRTMHIATPE